MSARVRAVNAYAFPISGPFRQNQLRRTLRCAYSSNPKPQELRRDYLFDLAAARKNGAEHPAHTMDVTLTCTSTKPLADSISERTGLDGLSMHPEK